MSARVLIAGVGNIFQADDAFGVEVAQRLSRRTLPRGVEVRDFGIRGFDLAYAMMEPWDLVILVDAMQRGETPGTLYVMEPHEAAESAINAAVETHGMTPLRAIELVKSLGGEPPRMLVVGCEPADLGGEDGAMGLTPAIAAVLDPAADLVLQKVSEFLAAASAASAGARA
jgi:hydrogenase maturation protease